MNLDDINKLAEAEIQAQSAEIQRPTVLICGYMGTGKSSLIRAICGPEIVTKDKIAHGPPGTTAYVTYENQTVRFWDSQGLEPGDQREDFLDRTRKFVRERQADPDLANHIHLVWYCIQGCGARVTSCDLTLIQEIFSNVLVLITKDDITREEQRQSIREQLISHGVASERILHCSETSLESLKAVVQVSQRMLPQALQDSFLAAQLVDLEAKKAQAQVIIHRAALAAAAAGAIPIPFSDAALITPIQLRMVVKLAFLYGFQPKSMMAAVPPLLARMAGVQMASSLSKFIPGFGSVIQASVAAALTEAVGQLTSRYLVSCLEARRQGQPLPTFHVNREQISALVLPQLPPK